MTCYKEVKVMVCADPYFLAACPIECLKKFLRRLPAKLTEPARRCRWIELSLRANTRVISGVAVLNSCPTGLRASYMEIYLGYFIPFLVKPDLQAVFRKGHLTSCRYGMQRQQLVEECRFESVKHGVDPKQALRVYRKLRESNSLPSDTPLVFLYMPGIDEMHVFTLLGRKGPLSNYK